MKRRQLRLCVAISAVVSLIIAINVGCSSDRMQVPSGKYIGAVSGQLKNPIAHDPTARQILEGQGTEELWIIGRSENKEILSGDEQIPGSGALATQIDNKFVPIPLKHTDV